MCSITIAKYGKKAERQTDLKNYADKRPKVPTGKTTEGLLNQHAKEARRNLEGNKKIKHKRIADDVSAVLSIHSNVYRALRVRMPKKTIVPAPPQPPKEMVTDFAPPMVPPQTSIVIVVPPTRPKRKAATKATEVLQPSHKRKRSFPSVTEPDESMASTQTSPPTVSSTSASSRQNRRQMIKQEQIKYKPIATTI